MFSVSVYFGFYLSNRLKLRCGFLKEMVSAIMFTLSEIEFTHAELSDIFKRIGTRKYAGDFFVRCAANIRANGIRRTWEEAVDNAADRVYLTAEDIEVMKELGMYLGMSDIDGQKNAIGIAAARLGENIKGADEEYARMSKTYKSCGVLLGALCFIIIL